MIKITKYDIRCWKEAFEIAYCGSVGNFSYRKLVNLLRITKRNAIKIKEVEK